MQGQNGEEKQIAATRRVRSNQQPPAPAGRPCLPHRTMVELEPRQLTHATRHLSHLCSTKGRRAPGAMPEVKATEQRKENRHGSVRACSCFRLRETGSRGYLAALP
jgi:hypothetical protein